MRCLYVLYDGRCGLCRRARHWAAEQPAFVPLVFMEAGSDAARRWFPGLASVDEPEELVAVTDEGHVYRNDADWIMCLFALVETREWALRLASPLLRPLARQAFTVVSHERGRISRWLGLDDDEAAARLRRVAVPGCAVGAPAPPLRSIHEMVSTAAGSTPGAVRFEGGKD
jgi:predicted DCC family thiol-disulfide oxidoreductase YuxK